MKKAINSWLGYLLLTVGLVLFSLALLWWIADDVPLKCQPLTPPHSVERHCEL